MLIFSANSSCFDQVLKLVLQLKISKFRYMHKYKLVCNLFTFFFFFLSLISIYVSLQSFLEN